LRRWLGGCCRGGFVSASATETDGSLSIASPIRRRTAVMPTIRRVLFTMVLFATAFLVRVRRVAV